MGFGKVAALSCLVMAATYPPAAGQVASVRDVMRRVGAYVDAYGEKASIVVATETYVQEARSNLAPGRATRRIVADFAIVKVETLHGWQGFRDVVNVDGQSVSDRARSSSSAGS